MCKIIIVDDEKMIRMGIKQVISWDSIGIHEVFTAGSAKEALEIIRREKPEIIVTDINMAEMTGLELIQAVREIQPEAKILVLTGYDRFEYARECLRMQVNDLYLKPIDELLLQQSIQQLVEEVRIRRERQKKESLLTRTQGSSKQLRLDQMMRDIIENNEAKAGDIQTLKQEYSYETEISLQAAVIEPELVDGQRKNEMDFRTMSVRNICTGLVDAMEKGISFFDREYRIVIAYFTDEQNSVVEQIQQLSGILKDEFEIAPKIVVGNEVKGFEELYVSYNDAMYLLEHEKDDFRDIVQMNDSQNRNDMFIAVFAEMKRLMTQNAGDEEYVLHVYDSFAKAADSYNLSESYVKRCCFECASEVYYTYINETRGAVDSRLNIFMQSLMNVSRREACEITREFLGSLIGRKTSDSHEIISGAKRYITEHLGEDITVSNIAAALYVSPNYFSRLFKRIQGEGCNEYIIEKRIEKAKSLLSLTNFKAGKIASMVGYRDANYFTLAFKKHTGMAPIEYREEIRKEQC